jgi:tRNA threonylcarbamoyladenosine biosynthesis protein TsaB
MKILSFDISTPVISIAVSEDDKIITYRNIKPNTRISNVFLSTIVQVLEKKNLSIEDMDAFVVGLGPGSFTSLKVGVACAKGLSFARNKPVVGISSLDAIAYGVEAKDVTVICDARRNLFYQASYHRKDGNFKCKGGYHLSDMETIFKRVTKTTTFVGDGIDLIKEDIQKKFKNISFAKKNFWAPQAKNLIPLAFKRLQNNEVDDVEALVPLYLYKEDWQVTKSKKKK